MKWSLHLSAPCNQQQTKLSWMCSYFVHFYAAGTSQSGRSSHSLLFSRNIPTYFPWKMGKVSEWFSFTSAQLCACERFIWNTLHTRPFPLWPGCLVWHETSCYGQPVIHQSLIVSFTKAIKKNYLQPCKVPAHFWLKSNMRTKMI